jgi:hypothetical protein
MEAKGDIVPCVSSFGDGGGNKIRKMHRHQYQYQYQHFHFESAPQVVHWKTMDFCKPNTENPKERAFPQTILRSHILWTEKKEKRSHQNAQPNQSTVQMITRFFFCSPGFTTLSQKFLLPFLTYEHLPPPSPSRGHPGPSLSCTPSRHSDRTHRCPS